MKKRFLAAALVVAALTGFSPVYAARHSNTTPNALNGLTSEQLSGYSGTIADLGQDGGALYNSSTLQLSDGLNIKNNFFYGYGGAIFNDRTGILTIGDNALFSNNYALEHGGAILNEGNLTIGTGARFENNGKITLVDYNPSQWTLELVIGRFTATGGALDFQNSTSNFSLDRASFTGNQALEGGAVSMFAAATGDYTFTNSTFTSNRAGSAGGAISAEDGNGAAKLGISNSTFNNNTAYAAGGAVWTGRETEITNSTFKGNTTTATSSSAISQRLTDIKNFDNNNFGGLIYNRLLDANRMEQGGGGAIFVGEGSATTVTGSIFENNSSATVGGAIATHTNATSLSIKDSSFKNNSATGNGGAIYSTVDLDITAQNADVEFSGNTAAAGKDIFFGVGGKALNLIANVGRKISFKSGIDLNNGDLDISGTGDVLIDAALNNAANINLRSGGNLQLGQSFSLTGTPDATIAGALNSQNGKIDIFNVNNFTGGGTWDFDVDLNSGTADFFNIGGTNSGVLSLDVDKIEFLSGSSSTSNISIDVSNKNILDTLNKNLYVDSFMLSKTLSDGKTLVFEYMVNPVETVLQDTDAATLNLTKNLTLSSTGTVISPDLTIKGSGAGAIIAAGTSGITGFSLTSGTGLTLNNITLDGFDTGISNIGGTLNLVNTSFLNSTGNAITTDTDLTITANNGASIFSGNANGIHLATGATSLTLDAQNGGVITLNDTITSDDPAYTLNLTGNSTGTVNLNNSIGNAAVMLTGTTLNLGDVSYLNGLDFTANSGTLDMTNIAAIRALNLGTLTLNGNMNLAVKADLANEIMDTISAGTYSLNGNNVNVSRIKLLSDALNPTTIIQFADDDLKGSVSYTGAQGIAYSPIYKYGVDYDNATGAFTFNRAAGGGYGDFNPAIMASPVAAQAGVYATQLNTFRESFNNMDKLMLMGRNARFAMKNQNRVTISETGSGQPFSLYTSHEEGSGWYRPHVSIERVNLGGIDGADIKNFTYGSYFGGDLQIKELKNGWSVVNSFLGGYTGAHQSFDDVGNYQNGVALGATSTFYKKDFFAGITANTGYMNNLTNTMFGKDNFNTISSGVAVKFGNNFEWKKLIMQPSMMVGYSFIKTFDYKTASGVDIKSDPLNAIILQPGLKLIGNFESGCQPYLAANVVWNAMGKTNVRANDIFLPEITVRPFAQYGVGVQKAWNDRFSMFVQAMVRSGGRTGIDFSAGLSIAVGKDYKKDAL